MMLAQKRAPSPAVAVSSGVLASQMPSTCFPRRHRSRPGIGGLALHDVVVTDLDHDCVQEHHSVDGIQRPVLPGLHLLEHGVGDPGDRLADSSVP